MSVHQSDYTQTRVCVYTHATYLIHTYVQKYACVSKRSFFLMFTTGRKGRKGTVRRQKWTYSAHLKSSLTGVMILSDCFFRVQSNTGEEKNVRIVIMVLAYAYRILLFRKYARLFAYDQPPRSK